MEPNSWLTTSGKERGCKQKMGLPKIGLPHGTPNHLKCVIANEKAMVVWPQFCEISEFWARHVVQKRHDLQASLNKRTLGPQWVGVSDWSPTCYYRKTRPIPNILEQRNIAGLYIFCVHNIWKNISVYDKKLCINIYIYIMCIYSMARQNIKQPN